MSKSIRRFKNNQINKEITKENFYKNNYSKLQKKEKYKFNENKKVFISYKKLKEIKNKDDNEIILFFQEYDDLSQVFKNTKFSEEMIYLMADILTRISFLNSSPALIILYQILENTSFFEKNIKDCLSNININNNNYLNFILNIIKLSDKILDKFSKSNKRIKRGDLLDIEDILNDSISPKEKEEKNENDILIEKILEEIKKFKERERHINIIKAKEKEEQLNNKDIKNNDKVPIDYKNADVLIKKEEFEQKYDKMISPHIKSGPYFSYERYLNTNFYLEREDCYRDLRKAIKFLQSQGKAINDMNYQQIKNVTKKFANLYFYVKGEIAYIEINSNGMVITIDFQGINSKKIKFTK